MRGLKLPEIPPEVGGLADLRMLFLSGNKIKDLASLSGLTDLQSLWLQNNEIKDLVPLGGLLFDNVLFDIDWITTAVYGITENQAIIKRNGRFTREEIIAVWANKGVTDRSDH
ncbi:leucine-rich repeat domain-containing protein [Lewinella cohaerens]|uniref:leucine-rich repeat domain-containing protein n=1 Tax=Lewinella cohaerens TaxID=70995 RepID=UPI0003A38D35|nr:leucine-rich repeat domain-containing protein [Lewinella cohaerens]